VTDAVAVGSAEAVTVGAAAVALASGPGVLEPASFTPITIPRTSKSAIPAPPPMMSGSLLFCGASPSGPPRTLIWPPSGADPSPSGDANALDSVSPAGRIDSAFAASALRSMSPESSVLRLVALGATSSGARSSASLVRTASEKRTEFSFRCPVILFASSTALEDIICGTAGDTVGAVIAYIIGYYGGRPLVERFGRLVFVRERELAHAHDWIVRFGARAVFACKLLPGVRAVASLPAGVVRMPFGRFLAFTLLASSIWCTGFAYAGLALGRNWDSLNRFFDRFAILLLVLVVIGIGVWIWSHLRGRAQRAAAAKG